jgi:hypothetical protein
LRVRSPRHSLATKPLIKLMPQALAVWGIFYARGQVDLPADKRVQRQALKPTRIANAQDARGRMAIARTKRQTRGLELAPADADIASYADMDSVNPSGVSEYA